MGVAQPEAPAMEARGAVQPSHSSIYWLLTLMVFFWSLNFVIGKIALREFPPLLLAVLRIAVAGIVILPIFFARNGVRTRLTWRSAMALFFLGAFGIAFNQVFFVLGLARTSVAHSAILIAATPVQVLLLAAAAGQEKLTVRKVLGLGIAIAGVLLLQVSRDGGNHPSLVGDILILLCGFALALYTVFGKPLTQFYDSITMNTFAYAGGAVLLSPVLAGSAWRFNFAAVSWGAWLSLLYMAVFSSVVSYIIYNHALKYVAASRVSAFSYLQPLLATLLAIPLLGEHLTTGLIVGGALVLTGVVVTERS